jgi:hypothetical protein
MTDAFTCQVHQIKRAPKRIELLGDKAKRPESAQHVIEFPGGAIEVSRTSSGDYWAHIIINRDWANDNMEGLRGAYGEVVGHRLGRDDDRVRPLVPDEEQGHIAQIAVLIRSSRSKGNSP